MTKFGEKIDSSLIEVGIETVPTTYLRPGLHTATPYPCIKEIEVAGERKTLPSDVVPSVDLDTEGSKQYIARLTRQMVASLVGYIDSRTLATDGSRGNCHDLTCYLIGIDVEPPTATWIVNSLLSDKLLVAESVNSVPFGDVVVVAHPNHVMVGPIVNGARHPDYSAEGHGPLRVQHSAVSIGSVVMAGGAGEYQDVSHALQRMSLNGPFGLTSIPEVMRQYEDLVPNAIDPSCWAEGHAPRPDEVCLYRLPSKASVAASV